MQTASVATVNSGALARTTRPCPCATAPCRPNVLQLCHDTALVHEVVRQFLTPPLSAAAPLCSLHPSFRFGFELSLGRQLGFVERHAFVEVKLALFPIPAMAIVEGAEIPERLIL